MFLLIYSQFSSSSQYLQLHISSQTSLGFIQVPLIHVNIGGSHGRTVDTGMWKNKQDDARKRTDNRQENCSSFDLHLILANIMRQWRIYDHLIAATPSL